MTQLKAWLIAVFFPLLSAGPLFAQGLGRVDLTGTGTQAQGGSSSAPAVSDDGRFVAFDSRATNLAAGDTNGRSDVFVRDRLAGATICVSVTPGGATGSGHSYGPAISSDGRFVAFISEAADLTGYTGRAIYRRDLHAGVTTMVMALSLPSTLYSVDDRQTLVNVAALKPAISANGTVVASGGVVVDLTASVTQTVPICADAARFPSCQHASLSADGRLLAFDSGLRLPGEPASMVSFRGPLVFDRVTTTTTRLAPLTEVCKRPSISGDGRYVAMECSMGSIGLKGIAVRDRMTDTAVAITTPPSSPSSHFHSVLPQISRNGRYVVFHSFAPNVAAYDHNDAGDVYLHDRVTRRTRRLSTGYAGETNDVSLEGAVSADGGVVAFTSAATQLVAGDTNNADDVFAVESGASSDLLITASVSPGAPAPSSFVTVTITVTNNGPATATGVVVGLNPSNGQFGLGLTSCQSSGEAGCQLIFVNWASAGFAALPPGRTETIVVGALYSEPTSHVVSVDFHGVDPNMANNFVTLAIPSGSPAPEDTDVDGLPNEWEARFGLNPNSSVGVDGAASDPDHDGRTNLQEYVDGTHPRGFVTRYLAEGATGTFFDTSVALLNPGATPASLLLRFLRDDGTTVSQQISVPAGARRTLRPSTLTGLTSANFSTVIESDALVIVDRTMTWGNGYGSHAETALSAPSRTWYLAEGSTAGEFNLFYLLQNPNAASVQATVRYLRPFGQPPVEKVYTLRPNSRTTIYVNAEGAAVASTDLSAVITADAPIIAERAMYINKPGQPFAAGHESAGVTAPALEWFLAEGATGPFFDEFVLIANPNPTPAQVIAEYLLLGGGTLTKTYTVPGNGRFTIYVDAEEIPAGSGQRPLTNVAVSTTIRSTNNVPVIVERAMWWPGPAISPNYWYEAHNSPGATTTGTRWALAEGEVGGPTGLETYVLIANTSATAGSAKVTLHFEDGSIAERIYPLAARSRTNVAVGSDFPVAAGTKFGVVIEGLGGAQLVVERAMYSSAGGVVWSAGTNGLATRLP